MDDSAKKKKIAQLLLIDKMLKQRESVGDPVAYGLPDLLRPQEPHEDDEDFEIRRRQELKDYIENQLYFSKDGKKINILLIDPMLNLIYDCFYRKVWKAILWKPRGSGGSVSVSIIIFLMMVYHKMTFTLIAGGLDQSQVVYRYVTQLWLCNSTLAAGMLASEPLKTKITMKPEAGGCWLECIPASEKGARGKHTAGLVVDEAAQRDAHTDTAITAAIQGPVSEKEYLIILCSTFHTTSGLYQEYWDYANDKGYKRYKWSIFDAMAPCKERIDCKKCELTRVLPKFSKDGKLTSIKYEGCAGKARYSKGWKPFKNVLDSKKQNQGTSVFITEFECERSYGGGSTVYNKLDLVEADKVCPKDYNGFSYVPYDKEDCEFSIGVDWGKVQTAIVLLVKTEEYIGVLEARAFTGANFHEVTRYLQGLHRKYRPGSLVIGNREMGTGTVSDDSKLVFIDIGGLKTQNAPITIWGDSSHPFNNRELKQMGYVVEEVQFNQWKDFGIENITKYLYTNRLWIPNDRPDGDFSMLTKQMQLYVKDEKGKPVKKNDHFNDALMCAGLAFPYITEFAHRDMLGGLMPTDDQPSEVTIL